jgi:hypothetical protein
MNFLSRYGYHGIFCEMLSLNVTLKCHLRLILFVPLFNNVFNVKNNLIFCSVLCIFPYYFKFRFCMKQNVL